MASASQAVTATRSHRPFTGRNGLVDKYFYFAMALLLPALVVWGFSHTADANLFHAAVPRPTILWFHAAAFSLWLVFFLLQSLLVRTHHVVWHRTLGWFGLALGVIMIVLGDATAVVMGRFDTRILHQAGTDVFEFISFYDMFIFTIWLALGIYWRRKPELHRRVFFIATCCLIGAAFGRVPWLVTQTYNLSYACVDAVILLGVVRDLLVNRRIHKLYLVALPLLAVSQAITVRILATPPAWWVALAHKIFA